MTTTQTTSPAAVIGLGPMGSALARALLAADVPTTVWNRTAARAEPLMAAGAVAASTPAEAVRPASVVVVCLRDHPSVREVLGTVDPADLSGRVVVNLTSGTPQEARATADWASGRGIAYLTGAIMVPTPLIGAPEGLVLYSGDRAVFDRAAPVLRHLAGQADHLGADHGLAPLHDVAMLGVFFAGMTSFLHAAAMVGAHGVRARSFLPYAQTMLSILPATIEGIARDVDGGAYPGDEDNVAMEHAALEHIVAASAAAGVDTRLPALMRDLAAETIADGGGHHGWSRVVETLRAG